jgi:oxygen-independent coproporphyrinogen-3 oxidase
VSVVDARLLVGQYDARVPRYTSYPTAPHFRAVVGDGWQRDWLARAGRSGAMSLYIHVPFCRAMCWYCGCHTRVAKDDVPIHAYVGALRREIELVEEAIGTRAPVGRLHWGGGTPSILPPQAFRTILDDLERVFDLTPLAEHAVEIDPRTLTGERVEMLAVGGVTRVSLGIQTFAERVQHRINRVQTLEQVASGVERLAAAGITSFNADLMYGLPAQSSADVIATIEEVVRLKPARVSLFGYAHVPWMKPHQLRIDEAELPDAHQRFDQLLAGADSLADAGYRRIGLDHFARLDDGLALAAEAGGLRRNFQGYTDDPASMLIGLGASAISEMWEGYTQSLTPIPDWQRAIFAGRLPVARMRALSPEDRLRRSVIQDLMCERPVDLEQRLAEQGYPPGHLDECLARLAGPASDGLIAIDGRRLRVAADAWPFLRSLAAAFDAYLSPDETRHARAV